VKYFGSVVQAVEFLLCKPRAQTPVSSLQKSQWYFMVDYDSTVKILACRICNSPQQRPW
jgi:hypothetical protein